MSMRRDDRDYERGSQNYGRRGESDYRRSEDDRSRGRYGYGREESERYATENRWRGESSSRPSRYSGESQWGRGESGGRDWESDRDFGAQRESRYGGGQDYDYDRGSSGSSQRYNYPTGFRSSETYGGHGHEDYRGSYDRGRNETRGYQRGGYEGRGYEYDRGDYESGEDRGWWDRASDAVASWFGDEDAERRRRMDQRRDEWRGRGPKGYRRSDERIKEDVSDRLSEGYLDASDIEVSVSNTEVTLTGNVNSRTDKRRAEMIAESVNGVSNVENRLRVRASDLGRYSGAQTTGAGESGTTSSAMSGTSGTGTTGSTGSTGTTGASRARSAGS